MKSLALAVVTLVTLLPAQFLEVTVQLDVERLSERERQEIQGLKESIRQFYLHSPWDRDIDDLEMVLDLQLVFQSTVDIGNEIYFQAQVLFNNQQDQRYFVRDATFPYATGRSINLSPVFDPLASFLEFHAYILIAGELDTYEILAGSSYYTRASNLATRGVNDPYVGRGWGSRDQLVKRLTANQDIRRAKAYFYQALETLTEEEPDPAALKKHLVQFHGAVSAVVQREGLDRYLTIFLSGHAQETAEMLARAGMWQELADMQVLDPDSEHIYRGFLEEREKGS